MVSNCDLLVNYQEFSKPEPVVLGDGRSVLDLGTGEICVTMLLGPKKKDERKSTMTEVLCVPKLAANLFTARAAAMKGKVVQFGHTLCWIKDSRRERLWREAILWATCIVWYAELKEKGSKCQLQQDRVTN